MIYSIFILLAAALTAYTAFFTYSIQNAVHNQIRTTLQIYNAQIKENLDNVQSFLIQTGNYNVDISTIASHTDLSGIYSNVAKVRDLFSNSYSSYANIDGLFAYFPANDTFISRADLDGAVIVSPFSSHLRSTIRSDSSFLARMTADGMKWNLMENEGNYYLVRIIRSGNAYLGAWANTTTLFNALTRLKDQGSFFFFTNRFGHALSSPEEDAPTIPIDQTLGGYRLLSFGGEHCLAVTEKLGFCDYYLSVLVPLSSILGQIQSLFTVLLLLIAASAVMVFFVAREAKKVISRPLGLLQDTAQAISAGDVESRIDTSDMHSEELLDISRSFNQMIDTIENLKITVYEDSLQKKDIELHYLQSQVSPHFFINCLNLIGLLADGTKEHSAMIQQMITQLSKHLRYTLRAKSQVRLGEEIEYVKNYIAMTELRFPGCLDVHFDIEKEAENATVFPLILLMFTENTFKFNLVMGEPLSLWITAKVTDTPQGKRLHLTHIDSGDGYTENLLDAYRNPQKISHLADRTGHHIGIYNGLRRIQLFYGDSAKMLLSNEPGAGARNDIDIPYIPYHDGAEMEMK